MKEAVESGIVNTFTLQKSYMAVRFTRDRLILYVTITLVFLIHWIHNDLALNPGKFQVSLLNNLWQVMYVMGLNFLYFEYAMPVVTSAKAHRLLSIVASIVAYLAVFVAGLYAWWLLGIQLNIYNPFRPFSNAAEAFSIIGRVTPGAFILFAVFKLFFDYTQLRYEAQQARLEKKQAELQFLKSQVNPHFLFNTLNNIYGLSQYQPKLVSESILRLSKILRYLLYETAHEFTTIDRELKILTDYIDLEKLRYNKAVTIDFHFEVANLSEMMPPLLLIPLVENAFKHGVSVSRGKRFVDVKLVLSGQTLTFVVRNSVPAAPGSPAPVPPAAATTGSFGDENSDPDYPKDNIGLSNLRRRLSLLYKDFELVTGQKDSVFTATLTIRLSSHV